MREHVENSVAPATSSNWLVLLRRYLLITAVANLVWEVAQLPLYTIWMNGTAGEIAFDVMHCTGGDILITSLSVLAAQLLLGNGRWPAERYGAVATVSIVIGIAVTIYSEWRNVEVLRSWAYSPWMPRLPVIGTGLAPLAQWIVIPIAGFWWCRLTNAGKGRS